MLGQINIGCVLIAEDARREDRPIRKCESSESALERIRLDPSTPLLASTLDYWDGVAA
jgi:hypothetical protein